MSALSRRGILIPLALAFVACQPPAAELPGALSEEDLAAIATLRDAFVQTQLAGAWGDLAALYAEEAVRMPPNHPTIEGRAAIQEALEAGPPVSALTIAPVETAGLRDLAYERGTYSVTLTVEGMPEPVTETGKYLVVARRQADGSWLITAHIWNSDEPMP